MTKIDPIYVGKDATQQLLNFCQQKQLKRFTLVADTNTYKALGQRVENALKTNGYDVKCVVLMGKEVIADEHYIVETLLDAQLGNSTFIAVGSGTLTDITRFSSHRSNRDFIAMPTAPSVDGFTSIGAPIVISGVKLTINCQAPIALFGDLDTLRTAPQRLIAAGFGDMVGKYTSLADWQLGGLLWDEGFSQSIYDRTRAAIDVCVEHADEIGRGGEEGVRQLMNALIESGLCMLEVGHSKSASGAEHHASHYWEMKLLKEHRPAALHGAKVGYALTLIAKQYAKIRALSRQEMLNRLEEAAFPDRDSEIQRIRDGFADLADDIAKEHSAFLNLTPEKFDALKHKIATNWEAIQKAAATVPAPETIIDQLRRAGAVTEAQALGLSEGEVKLGLEYGHYLRNRFTVMKLSRILGVSLV